MININNYEAFKKEYNKQTNLPYFMFNGNKIPFTESLNKEMEVYSDIYENKVKRHIIETKDNNLVSLVDEYTSKLPIGSDWKITDSFTSYTFNNKTLTIRQAIIEFILP